MWKTTSSSFYDIDSSGLTSDTQTENEINVKRGTKRYQNNTVCCKVQGRYYIADSSLLISTKKKIKNRLYICRGVRKTYIGTRYDVPTYYAQCAQYCQKSKNYISVQSRRILKNSEAHFLCLQPVL